MYVYDGHNNPAGLVTNFGSLAYLLNFDPYGGATVAQNSGGTGYVDNPYTYSGGVQSHTTQLIKFGARWYDPTTGTWTQQDTLNAPLDPHNGNRYTYAAGNPINNADPAGRFSIDFSGCVGVVVAVCVDGGIGDSGVTLSPGVGLGVGAEADVTATPAEQAGGGVGDLQAGGCAANFCAGANFLDGGSDIEPFIGGGAGVGGFLTEQFSWMPIRW